MMHLAKTLFLDYKWSSVYNFYKINCSAKTFTVSSQVFFERGIAVRMTVRTSLGRRANVFCLHYMYLFS